MPYLWCFYLYTTQYPYAQTYHPALVMATVPTTTPPTHLQANTAIGPLATPYHLQDAIDAFHAFTQGHANIRVAIIDTAINQDHPALTGAAIEQVNLHPDTKIEAQEAANVASATGHGTQVASIIAGNPESPAAGIAPACTLVSIPVYQQGPQGLTCTQEDMALAIDKAVAAGAHIINVSGGELTTEPSSFLALQEAVNKAVQAGCLVVAATGNNGCDCLHVPASLPGVVAAGAMDAQGTPLPFSNYGNVYRQQGLLAPVDPLQVAINPSEYLPKKATSYAAPVLAGFAALMLSLQEAQGQALDTTLVKQLLFEQADACLPHNEQGCQRYLAGSFNAAQTLEAFINTLDQKPQVQAPAQAAGVAPQAALQAPNAYTKNSTCGTVNDNFEALVAPHLQHPYTKVHSFKITESQVSYGRFFLRLATQDAQQLKVGSQALQNLCTPLGLAPQALQEATAQLPEHLQTLYAIGAGAVGPHERAFRLYLGFSNPPQGHSGPIGISVSWAPGGPVIELKEYAWPAQEQKTMQGIQQALAFAPNTLPAQLLEALMPQERLSILQVSQPGQGRLSFDIGLAQQDLNQTLLGLLPAEVLPTAHEPAHMHIENVAVGLNNHEQPFATLYYTLPAQEATQDNHTKKTNLQSLRNTQMSMSSIQTPTPMETPEQAVAHTEAPAQNAAEGQLSPSECACQNNDAPKAAAPSAEGSAAKASNSPNGDLVYVIGTLSVAFATDARRDSLAHTISGNPEDPKVLAQSLQSNPELAEELIFTISNANVPLYAIRPTGAFSAQAYQRLIEFYNEQVNGSIERVALPGIIQGTTQNRHGQQLNVVIPALRGLASWTTDALMGTVDSKDDNTEANVRNFLDRVYYELRNRGLSPKDRAINYAASNVYQVGAVFSQALKDGLQLANIGVANSPLSMPGRSMFDVELSFFNPLKRQEEAVKVYSFAVDVTDVIPVTVGDIRSWSRFN